jgi:hypothetical protein
MSFLKRPCFAQFCAKRSAATFLRRVRPIEPRQLKSFWNRLAAIDRQVVHDCVSKLDCAAAIPDNE